MHERMRDRLENRDLNGIRSEAEVDRRTLSRLLPFTYQLDGLLRWRAVEALGAAAGVVADRDPEFVRGIVRRLFWSLSDESGSVGWSAPEAIGEIVANRPQLFADYAPMVVSLFENLEEAYFRPGILWAIGRIASVAPALVAEAAPMAIRLLSDRDPHVRGAAVWCLGRIAHPEAAAGLRGLLSDTNQIAIYMDGEVRATTVGGLARDALDELSRHSQP